MIRSDTHDAREQMINYFVIALLISRAVSVWRMFWKQTLAYHLWVSDKQWSFQSSGLKYRFVKRYQVWQETSEVLVTVSPSLIHRVTWIREMFQLWQISEWQVTSKSTRCLTQTMILVYNLSNADRAASDVEVQAKGKHGIFNICKVPKKKTGHFTCTEDQFFFKFAKGTNPSYILHNGSVFT